MVRARNVNKTKKKVEQSDWEQEEFKSRSDIKRAAQAVTDLGQQLADLPEQTLKRMPLPHDLLEALLLTKRIKGSALKRQKQFIGRYLRENEPLIVEIKQFFEAEELQAKRRNLQMQQMEKWRDRLIAEGDAALNDLIFAYPQVQADRTELRQWIRNAQNEVKAEKPAKTAKIIFKYLKETCIE